MRPADRRTRLEARRRHASPAAVRRRPVAAPRPRRAGPAELFAEVAPLLAGGPRGEDAFARLAVLLQEDPALIDLRLDGDAVARTVDAAAPHGLGALDDASRDGLARRALPALVPARFGREAAEVFATVADRRTDPLDPQALALGRYFAILDDVEGAAGAGTNPLWHLLFELTWAEAALDEVAPRDLLDLPAPDAVAVAGNEPPPPRLEPSLAAAYQHAIGRVLDE